MEKVIGPNITRNWSLGKQKVCHYFNFFAIWKLEKQK